MRFIGFFLLQFIFLTSLSQNLIPNPGFEETTGCPGASVNLKHTNGWHALPNHNGSPDQFYGDCGYNGIINSMAPNQLPYEGEGYVGGFCFYGQYDQGEYMFVELLEPMVKDSVYYVEFHVLPSPRYTNFIDSYGAHFTVNPPIGNGNGLKTQSQFVEHIGNPRGVFITDTINWTTISGLYKAKGGEQFMLIGNFRNTANTNVEPFTRGNHINPFSSYFFVDGVGVKLDDGTPFEWEVNVQPGDDVVENPIEFVKDSIIPEKTELKIKADFITDKTEIKIEVWDHQRVDNDTINLMLDDDFIAENFPLKKQKKRFTLTLEKGEYILSTVALNLGEIPPNTAAIRIKDGDQTKLYILRSKLDVTEAIRIIVK